MPAAMDADQLYVLILFCNGPGHRCRAIICIRKWSLLWLWTKLGPYVIATDTNYIYYMYYTTSSRPAGHVRVDTLYYSQYGRLHGIQRAHVSRYIVCLRYTMLHDTMWLTYLVTGRSRPTVPALLSVLETF